MDEPEPSTTPDTFALTIPPAPNTTATPPPAPAPAPAPTPPALPSEPPKPPPENERDGRWLWWRKTFHFRVPSTILVLGPDGGTEQLPERGPLTHARWGSHITKPGARHWLPKPIPAGWLTIFPYTNGGPIVDGHPVGLTSKDVQIVTGPMTLRAVGGAFEGRSLALPLRRVLIIVGAIALGLLGTYFVMQSQGLV